MSNLSLEEFNKLSKKEKGNKYKDLNAHDKFLTRISTSLGYEVIGNSEVTKEEKEWADKLHKEILKQNK